MSKSRSFRVTKPRPRLRLEPLEDRSTPASFNGFPSPLEAGVAAAPLTASQIPQFYRDTSSYTIPTATSSLNVYFVAPDPTNGGVPATNVPEGKSTNTGLTASSPVTVARAVQLINGLPSGRNAAIIFRGGEYRDVQFQIYFHALTLQAHPGETPVLNGTKVVTNWTSAGSGLYSTDSTAYERVQGSLEDITFNGGNRGNGQYNDLEQVFVDGRPLWQVALFFTHTSGGTTSYYRSSDNKLLATKTGTNPLVYNTEVANAASEYARVTNLANNLALVNADTFYVDRVNHRLYMGVNPAGKKVELSNKEYGIKLYNTQDPDPITVKGLNFFGYADADWDHIRQHVLVEWPPRSLSGQHRYTRWPRICCGQQRNAGERWDGFRRIASQQPCCHEQLYRLQRQPAARWMVGSGWAEDPHPNNGRVRLQTSLSE
jgi:hypothetical protein